ncbi:MAG TPA: carboxymuconolactone decarboxylase family protein [Candidatus Thermoplasmatota archaeon]|nr:carboxymuconolactone decarboxylase family protein [Candidatus Thermoplasmatota archaeon]
MIPQHVRQDIEAAFGTVPSFLERVPAPLIESEWETFKRFQLQDTALPMRTKELLGLAVASALQCPYCTYFHEAAARLHGASDEEITEAVFMAKHTAGWSTFLRGSNQPFEEFRSEVDGMVEYLRTHAGPAEAGPGGARQAGRSR